MRRFILATHGHFAAGIRESLELVFGEQENIATVCAFVDGSSDIKALVQDALDAEPEGADIVVCTDILGGSVNNEFLNALPANPQVHLIAGMNLPMLIALFLSSEPDTEKLIRTVIVSDDIAPRYCNDELRTDAGEDEDF